MNDSLENNKCTTLVPANSNTAPARKGSVGAVSRWCDIIGNQNLVETMQSLGKQISHHSRGIKPIKALPRIVLASGKSRTGKSLAISMGIRTGTCQVLDETTLDPCDREDSVRISCNSCKQKVECFSSMGLFALSRNQHHGEAVQTLIMDCGFVNTQSLLTDRLNDVTAGHYQGLNVIWFEEAHLLAVNKLEGLLLNTIEKIDTIWIFSTAYPEKLEQMLRRRADEVETQRPTTDEMIQWLRRLCTQHQISFEEDALSALAGKSSLVPGVAVKVLEKCLNRDTTLSVDFVTNRWSP